MDHSILLKNGVVLQLEAGDRTVPTKADVLIKGNRIHKVGNFESVPNGTEIVDCTNKIVAPGFIDTHRHMYNIALRGRHGNSLLEDYFAEGILQASNFSPEEIYWGQLGGCLEAINAGTTTVVDHSHMNYSKDHPRAAIEATIASGLRSIYGYCFNVRVDTWSPLAFQQPLLAQWSLDALKELSSRAPFGDGRVTLGIAFDGWFLPNEMLIDLFKTIQGLGIKHLTSHNSPARPGATSSIQKMEDCRILSSLTLLSHANALSASDMALVKKRNAHVSSTPSLELQMGMGRPVCFDPERSDMQSLASIGIDCHNAALASVPAELRLALQNARGTHNEKFLAQGKKAARVYKTVQETYALGTIAGARAIGMEDQIGSIAEGKLADLIVFDGLSPNMICGAQSDPVTAILLHSTPADIVMTIIDGRIRKRDGRLTPVSGGASADALYSTPKGSFQWEDVAQKVLETQQSLGAKIDKIDLKAAKADALKAFGYDPATIVENV